MDVVETPEFPVRLDRALKTRVASEVAERLGVTPATLSAWRRGRRRPNPKQIVSLCVELSVSADWLLGLVEDVPLEESDIRPMALVAAALEEVDDADFEGLDAARLVQALLNSLHQNDQLRAQLEGARKRTRSEVDNAVRDLQRKVLRGLFRALDAAGVDPSKRSAILEALDEEVENGLRVGRYVG